MSFLGIKFKMATPKITLGDKDRVALFGSALGPIGYVYGDKIGKTLQSGWESVSGKTSRVAQEKAMAAADKARRDSITNEYNAKQQAEQLAYGSAMTPRNAGGNSSPGVVGGGGDGTIGSNISSSGTF